MKKTYLSSDIQIKPINGINNIKETSNFFSSSLINIPDTILIDLEDFIWYEDANGEQIYLEHESNPKYYSSSNDKFENHKLYLEPNQSIDKLNSNTSWVMEINTKQLLFNYIYAKLKQNRTFDKLEQEKIEINYNSFLEKFININLLNKYKFEQLDLYIQNIEMKNGIKYKNIWNSNINKIYIYKNYNIIKNDDLLNIQFNQKNSSLYFFEYYYSIKFIRI
jgi:hypothetical protein